MSNAVHRITLRPIGDHIMEATGGTDGRIVMGPKGTPNSFTPVELLLAAIAGCSGIDLQTVSKNADVDPGEFELRVRGSKPLGGDGLTQINIKYTMPGIEPDALEPLIAEAKKVGITINLISRTASSVSSEATPCTPKQAACTWQAANWNSGWVYADPYLPTGEVLFSAGASTNFGSYSNPEASTLINDTISAPAAQETKLLSEYANYMAKQLPVICWQLPVTYPLLRLATPGTPLVDGRSQLSSACLPEWTAPRPGVTAGRCSGSCVFEFPADR